MPVTTSPLICFGPNPSFQAGEKSVLLTNPFNKESRLVPASLFNILSSCLCFKTAEAHAHEQWGKLKLSEKRRLLKTITETYAEFFGEIIFSFSGFEKMLAGIIRVFFEKGFFVSQDSYFKWAAEASGEEPQISSIGVVTRNRPDSLETCLTSYIQNSLNHSRQVQYLVFDDSPEKEIQNKNKDICRKLKQKFAVHIFYAGLEEKRDFVQKLSHEGIPRDVLEFALFPTRPTYPSYGANRNAFLLQTAGEMALSVDDDTVAEVGRISSSVRGIKFNTEETPEELWFFSTREDAIKSTQRMNLSILSAHEKILGRSLGKVLSGEQCENEVRSEVPLSYLDLIRTKKGKILVTFNGLVGDSGSNSFFPALFSTGKQRERLLKSEETYRSALKSREMVKSTSQVCLDFPGYCMTTFFGVDNRDILPPFFPVFRMEDAAFGMTIKVCSGNSLVGFIPETLIHSPSAKREYSADRSSAFSETWPVDILKVGLKTFAPALGYSDLAVNLALLGEHLKRFGKLSYDEYIELTQSQNRILLAQKVAAFEDILEKYPNSPEFWEKDVKFFLEDVRKIAILDHPMAPKIILNEFQAREGSEKEVQYLIHQFGVLLTWWPKIIEVTKQFKEQGITLAQTIKI